MSKTVKDPSERAYTGVAGKRQRNLDVAYMAQQPAKMVETISSPRPLHSRPPKNMLNWVKSPTKNLNTRLNKKRLSEKFNKIQSDYRRL